MTAESYEIPTQLLGGTLEANKILLNMLLYHMSLTLAVNSALSFVIRSLPSFVQSSWIPCEKLGGTLRK